MKKVLVLSGSPRVNGNSNELANQFASGARQAGHEVTLFNASRMKVSGCLGCNGCRRNNGVCVLKDDMQQIRDAMLAADVIVMASPIYFYTIPSQLKAVIDRCYAFESQVTDKSFYFLISCAAPEEKYAQIMLDSLRGYMSCLKGSHEDGCIVATSSVNLSDVKNGDYAQWAFELGRGIKD